MIRHNIACRIPNNPMTMINIISRSMLILIVVLLLSVHLVNADTATVMVGGEAYVNTVTDGNQVCSEQDQTCHTNEGEKLKLDEETLDDDEAEDYYDDDDYFDEDIPDDENIGNYQTTFDDDLCSDDNELCGKWAETGECKKNPTYMLENCQRSCNVCE